ncbi:MAG: hypothetical protein AAGJ67_16020 [Pseudomonadota bacterium]
MPQSLSEVDVLQRALAYNPEEVLPILEYLKLSESECQFKPDTLRQDAQRIAWHLRKAGSNTLATTTRMAKNKLKEALGKDTDTDVATYREVVIDVAKKVKAEATPNYSSFISQSADSIVDAIGGITSNTGAFVSGAVDLIQGANYEQYSTEELEKRIIEKLFVDAYEQMSQSERDALFRSLGIDYQEIPVGASSMLLIQLLLKKYGGFAVYKYSIIVAHWISKAIIGKGLPFAASPIIARAVSSFLGPVGWTASGLWAATALAGPAYRKTIPAVVHIAALRQLVLNRINIGLANPMCDDDGIFIDGKSPVFF